MMPQQLVDMPTPSLLPSVASELKGNAESTRSGEQLIEAVHAGRKNQQIRLQDAGECISKNSTWSTGPQALGRARQEAIIDRLPPELLSAIGSLLCHQQLAVLAQVSTRFRSLADDDEHWEKLWVGRWGSLAASNCITQRAVKVAGGWKKLFRSKALQDQASTPWVKACPHEVQAMVGEIVQHAGSGSEGTPGGVVFLLDGSGSVTEDDFSTMTTFAKLAIESLHAAHPECKFSNGACVELPLGIPRAEAVEDCISGMARMNGGTCIAEAVRVAGQLLKSLVAPEGARSVVLLTDGRVDHYQGREAVHTAQHLSDEQQHAALFGLGVGRGVDRDVLDSIIEAFGGGQASNRYLALAVHPHSSW
eukprot:jgi/Astpho2/3037/Aster-03345